MAKLNSKRALSFALPGIAALFGLYLEYLIILIEKYIYQKPYYKFTITEGTTHYIITTVLWGILGLVLFYFVARIRKTDLTKINNKPSVRGYVTAGLMFTASFGLKYTVYGGWKPGVDFRTSGWFQFLFQCIYGIFQSGLMLITAVFMQKACERYFRKLKLKSKHIPWGGIFLALAWGSSLLIFRNSYIEVLSYMALCFLAGAVYLAVNRNLYLAYLFAVLILLV